MAHLKKNHKQHGCTPRFATIEHYNALPSRKSMHPLTIVSQHLSSSYSHLPTSTPHRYTKETTTQLTTWAQHHNTTYLEKVITSIPHQHEGGTNRHTPMAPKTQNMSHPQCLAKSRHMGIKVGSKHTPTTPKY
jgi:hypothetical protein